MSTDKSKPIRVLLVDDSSVVRKAITELLKTDPGIELVGTAIDPYVARDKLRTLEPDVMLLDLSLPRMDGMTFLNLLMKHRPMPVIILSALVTPGSTFAIEALKAGAFDVVLKPSGELSLDGVGKELITRIKHAAKHASSVRGTNSNSKTEESPEASPRRAATERAVPKSTGPLQVTERVELRRTVQVENPRQLIVFGASTGGTEALKSLLTRLPAEMPGMAIVQHIPAGFSRSFADRLNNLCKFEVREAQNGDLLTPGLALLAPGGQHMELEWNGNGYRVKLNLKDPVHHQRPAVDVLFKSAAACAGKNVLAVLLTGMGRDGAEGMKVIKEAGGENLAQDRESCVVFGMPQAAQELGVVDAMVPLDQFPQVILRRLGGSAKKPQTSALALA